MWVKCCFNARADVTGSFSSSKCHNRPPLRLVTLGCILVFGFLPSLFECHLRAVAMFPVHLCLFHDCLENCFAWHVTTPLLRLRRTLNLCPYSLGTLPCLPVTSIAIWKLLVLTCTFRKWPSPLHAQHIDFLIGQLVNLALCVHSETPNGSP